MPVQDIARSDVVTVSPDATVEEMAERLRSEAVGSLVVVESGSPVGIVTDRDLGLEAWAHEDPPVATARELMSPEPVTVELGTGIYDAIQAMRAANVRRLPVVDGDALAGIVTLDDVLVLLAGELEVVSEVIQSESPPY